MISSNKMSELRKKLDHYIFVCEKIKFLKNQIKELNEIKKGDEQFITDYLKRRDFESVTYGNRTISIKQQAKRAYVSRARKESILRDHGVRDPEKILDELNKKTCPIEKLRLV